MEATNLVEDEAYEREARDEELCYLVSEAGATRAELPYTWHDGRVAELGAVRLLEFDRELDAADALLQQSLADAVEHKYDDAGAQRVVGVVVVDIVGASVEFAEHVREDVPRRGLFGRLRRRNGD